MRLTYAGSRNILGTGMIKAERRVTLLEDAGASERAVLDGGSICCGVWAWAAVLGDHNGAGGEQGLGFAAEDFEGAGVLFGCVVGGVEEEDVKGGDAFGD